MSQTASSTCVGAKLERASGPYLGFSTGKACSIFAYHTNVWNEYRLNSLWEEFGKVLGMCKYWTDHLQLLMCLGWFRFQLFEWLPFYCSANKKVDFSPASSEGLQRLKSKVIFYFNRYQSCREHWCCSIRGNQLLWLQRYHQGREVLAENNNQNNRVRFRMEQGQSMRGISYSWDTCNSSFQLRYLGTDRSPEASYSLI